MADIVLFPLKHRPRLCGNCEHAYLGSNGVYCSFFNEEYWNERIAEECDEYAEIQYVDSKIVNIKDRLS